MVIIACLGNPGRKYSRNRHNAGFIIGEHIAREHGISLGQKMFSAVCGQGRIGDRDVLLIAPQSYMNDSGTAVQKALNFYKSDPGDMIVIHDEIELPFGEFRLKFGGGHKGHNGLRSIIASIGTADFHRLRFGVGRPGNPEMGVADYVLSDFSCEEILKMGDIMPDVSAAVASLVEKAPA
ncbi:MAG: aminoacyl-tRNA hydrolase [Spirochaetes bacterium]|jgi:PTH1 family peptidyl-tRNA hydrolase|nr:aminoacyl-tRNA hydrolase [Spirochaetota bacterium]